ncbi:hypothetical protein [Pseudomonas sp. C9-3]|uniref:hypothetical protein n=1 Tax=Pseudomonas sp. C9-3 TaxID=3078264 RepID=UPI0028EC21FA|nr:hypothetical protein [Pseudomonas sp. C9-3]
MSIVLLKIGRLMRCKIVLAVPLLSALAGCANTPRDDVRDSGIKVEQSIGDVLKSLGSLGYQCGSASSPLINGSEREHYGVYDNNSEKYTCNKQRSGVFCVDNLFVDLIFVDGRLKNAGVQTVPVCIWTQ